MHIRILYFGTVLILTLCIWGHVSELFDHWDNTFKTGNDAEYSTVIVVLVAGAVICFAFDATEVCHHDDPSGGVVVRLSVNGAEFWLSQESPDRPSPSAEPVAGGMIRLILTVSNPDEVFARALKA